MKFIKCELCSAEIPDEKCLFADYKRVINGEEHYFCCESHADSFERKRKEKSMNS